VVIAKLEGMLERCVLQRDKNESNGEELDRLREEIAELQTRVRKVSYGGSENKDEVERLRKEMSNLEQLLNELREELQRRVEF
jgi:peptidoglycan hydrolase CwlO-like protein